MARSVSRLAKALIVLAVLVCEWQAHRVLSGSPEHWQGGAAGILLMIVPLLAVAALAATRIADRRVWVAVTLAACTATWLLMAQGRLGLAVFYGLPHAAIYLALCWMFGRTLLPAREPLITRLARQVHGTLPPRMEAYTRRATLAWGLFFGAQVAVSLGLLVYGTMDAWSLFVNRLNLPLLAAMFAGEYLYRIVRHPDFPHASIATAIGTFVKDSPAASGARSRCR